MTEQTQARPDEQDTISRLAARGEQTIARLAELPGAARTLGAMNELRGRVDELAKRVRGIDELERRITQLEGEVAALRREGPSGPPAV